MQSIPVDVQIVADQSATADRSAARTSVIRGRLSSHHQPIISALHT